MYGAKHEPASITTSMLTPAQKQQIAELERQSQALYHEAMALRSVSSFYGIERAMAQAKAAAGDRIVLMLGAYTAQRALEAGVLDELQIHQIPVLFGSGRRLFEMLPSRVELEIVRVIDTPEATHIRYRVRR